MLLVVFTLSLIHILKEYGYPNVEAFYKAFHKAETAYGDYQDSLKNWKQRYLSLIHI